MKLNLEVNLDFMDETGNVNEFVRDEIIKAVTDIILKEAKENFTKVAVTSVRKSVDEILVDEVKSLLAAPFTPVDSWGESKGEPTTLKELIKKRYECFMTEKVDLEGELGYGARIPRIEYLIGQAVKDQFNYDFKKMLEDEAKKAKQTMAVEISKVLAAALVRS